MVGLEDLLSFVLGLFNEVEAETSGTSWGTTVVLWGAVVELITSVVVMGQILVSCTESGSTDCDWGSSPTPALAPVSAGEEFPFTEDMCGVVGFREGTAD